ncbi:hypothetical protein DFJ77DRAFT_440027, partial [Powellomyces hirtus]
QEQGQEAWPVDLNDFMREERMDDLVLLYRSFNHLFGDRLVHEDMIYEVTHPTLNIVRFLHSHQSESFFRKLLMYYLGNVGDANPDVSFIQAVAAMKIDLFPLWIRCSFDMMSVIVELQPHIVHRKSTDRGLTALDQVLENSLEGILSSEDLCREVSQLLEWKSIPRTTILERLRIDLHRLKKKHRYRRFASKEHRDIAMELLKNLVPFFGTKQDCENIKSVIKTIGGIHEMKSNISRLGRSPRCHSMRTALEELGRRVAMAAWIVEPSAAMWRALLIYLRVVIQVVGLAHLLAVNGLATEMRSPSGSQTWTKRLKAMGFDPKTISCTLRGIDLATMSEGAIFERALDEQERSHRGQHK